MCVCVRGVRCGVVCVSVCVVCVWVGGYLLTVPPGQSRNTSNAGLESPGYPRVSQGLRRCVKGLRAQHIGRTSHLSKCNPYGKRLE